MKIAALAACCLVLARDLDTVAFAPSHPGLAKTLRLLMGDLRAGPRLGGRLTLIAQQSLP